MGITGTPAPFGTTTTGAAAFIPRLRRNLNVYQIAALNALFNVWDTTPTLENDKRLAYIVATVFHESFDMLYPIRECMCRDDAGSRECVRRLHAKGKASAYHRSHPKTGFSYYGRGQTQLTLDENYQRITQKLGLSVDLFKQPDEAQTLDISSRNAVLGLYHGWYRHVGGRWLGLKHIAFDSDNDWVFARQVLIGPRADSTVAVHGKKVASFLKFISRADFDSRFSGAPATTAPGPVAAIEPPKPLPSASKPPIPPSAPSTGPATTSEPSATSPSTGPALPPATPTSAAATPVTPASTPPAPPAATSTPPPAAAAPASPPAVPPSPPPVSSPQTPIAASGADAAMITKLTTEVRELERTAQRLQKEAADLGQQATQLRSALDVYALIRSTLTAGSDGSKSADDEGVPGRDKGADEGTIDPAVDYKTVWPPSHKAHGWCRVASREKALEYEGEDFDEDENKLLDRYDEMLTPPLAPEPAGGVQQQESKSAGEENLNVLRFFTRPLAPEAPVVAPPEEMGASQTQSWWRLPAAPVSIDAGTAERPLAPESRTAAAARP